MFECSNFTSFLHPILKHYQEKRYFLKKKHLLEQSKAASRGLTIKQIGTNLHRSQCMWSCESKQIHLLLRKNRQGKHIDCFMTFITEPAAQFCYEQSRSRKGSHCFNTWRGIRLSALHSFKVLRSTSMGGYVRLSVRQSIGPSVSPKVCYAFSFSAVSKCFQETRRQYWSWWQEWETFNNHVVKTKKKTFDAQRHWDMRRHKSITVRLVHCG